VSAHNAHQIERVTAAAAPAPLLRCEPVKKIILLLAIVGIAFVAAKKIRST
jgi:hypothetical protein